MIPVRNKIKQNSVRSFRLRLPRSAGLMLTVVIAAGIGGCKSKSAETAPASGDPKASSVAAQSTPTSVSATAARIGSILRTEQVSGSLTALQDVTVGVKLAGKVIAVYAREGDPVSRGQLVVQQDPGDLQAQLQQQRANLTSAITRRDQAKVALQSAQTNLKLTDAQTKSGVASAKASVQVAREQYNVIKNGARTQEREQAQETVTSAKADVDRAVSDREKSRADLKRYQGLYRQQAISAQQLDLAQATSDASDAAYASAQARLNSAKQSLSLIQEGSRPEDIRRAQASIDQANQVLVTAQANRDQVRLRQSDIETARVGIETAEAAVQQAQAAVHLAELAVNDTAIRSPINGVVAERKAEPGQQFGAGKDVMRIVALNPIFFDAQLTETVFAQAKLGQEVAVSVDALPGRTFKGTIYKVFPVASAQSRSFTVRVSIANEGNVLRPSMSARGLITLDAHPNAVLVPRDAVLDNLGTTGRVFVIKDGKAEERQVKIGYTTFKDLEITSGVSVGEQVVTVGQAQLLNGGEVKLLAAQTTDAQGAANQQQ